MSVLLLKLAGPLQSWGSSSRYVRRSTQKEPTKSAVIGLLASAQGRLRGDGIEDLLDLSFGVRIDQPGTLVNDFQTERPNRGEPMPPTHRYYMSDAKYLVGLGADDALLTGLDDALRHPRWPLFLGRRSCPPEYPVSLGLQPGDSVIEVLEKHGWIAAPWYKRRHPGCQLEVVCDAGLGPDAKQGVPEGVISSQADIPLSFGASRKYAFRAVNRYRIPNPDGADPDGGSRPGRDRPDFDHDPMSFF